MRAGQEKKQGRATRPVTELGLKRMSLISLVLESVRWALEERFPELLHPTAPDMPGWTKLFYVAQIIFFVAASCAAGGHVIDAIRTRNWKNLNPIGFFLYVAWWIEVGLAGGYLSHLGS
jgi:hypothetical protein